MPRKVERRGNTLPLQSMICSWQRRALDYRCSASHMKQMALPFRARLLKVTVTAQRPTLWKWEISEHGMEIIRLRDIARNGPDPGRQRLVHVAVRAPIVSARCAPWRPRRAQIIAGDRPGNAAANGSSLLLDRQHRPRPATRSGSRPHTGWLRSSRRKEGLDGRLTLQAPDRQRRASAHVA